MKQTKLLRMETSRLGIILSNYSIFGMLVIISSGLAMVLFALSVIIWLLLLICTLGAIITVVPNYMEFLTSGNISLKFIEIVTPLLPYIYWITLGTAVVSIVLMSFSYGKKPVTHIVLSSVVAGACLLFILGILGG